MRKTDSLLNQRPKILSTAQDRAPDFSLRAIIWGPSQILLLNTKQSTSFILHTAILGAAALPPRRRLKFNKRLLARNHLRVIIVLLILAQALDALLAQLHLDLVGEARTSDNVEIKLWLFLFESSELYGMRMVLGQSGSCEDAIYGGQRPGRGLWSVDTLLRVRTAELPGSRHYWGVLILLELYCIDVVRARLTNLQSDQAAETEKTKTSEMEVRTFKQMNVRALCCHGSITYSLHGVLLLSLSTQHC